MNQDKIFELKQAPFRQKKSPKRVLVKKSGKLPDGAIPGRVIGSVGKTFFIEYVDSDSQLKKVAECRIGGTIISPYTDSSIAAVGDDVFISFENIYSKQPPVPSGTILMVGERFSKLSRKAAGNEPLEHVITSNIDNLIIVVSAASPPYNTRLVDRLLVAAELGNLDPVILINKIDLSDKKVVKNDFSIYAEMGINCIFISALYNKGLVKLKNGMKEKNSVLIGSSGVGKSTIINKILGEEIQSVKEVSEKTSKGRHNTSYVRMFPLPFGGSVVDTPGIREFGVLEIGKLELAMYFHDFLPYIQDCRFIPCTHTHEPDCAVVEAVESGKISFDRYESYLNFYETLED